MICKKVIIGLLVLCFVLPSVFLVDAGAPTVSNIVLISGFEPFYIYDENPSQLVAEALNGTILKNTTIVAVVLPVNFTESITQITQAIQTYRPVLVISLGLNVKAFGIQVENFGINFRKRLRSDPLWFLLQPLDPAGPLLRRSTVPNKKIVKAIRHEGIFAINSFNAGTYVCNAVLYGTLGVLEKESLDTPMGFFHVPPLPSQEPYGMPLEKIVDAVEIAISTILTE
ncbi:MAG: hypothetical protein KKG04_02915 [Candidatus Thermoplasmatota archaeon]|nr:hypothetical protein [Candidatus Thermoplasmatota archaeon]